MTGLLSCRMITGDSVDYLLQGGWWSGYVRTVRKPPKGKVMVIFPSARPTAEQQSAAHMRLCSGKKMNECCRTGVLFDATTSDFRLLPALNEHSMPELA